MSDHDAEIDAPVTTCSRCKERLSNHGSHRPGLFRCGDGVDTPWTEFVTVDHHRKCYQHGPIPDDMPPTICDCRVLRLLEANPADRGHATLDLCLASATIGLACLALIEPRLLLVVAGCLVAWLALSVPLALGMGRLLARGGEEG